MSSPRRRRLTGVALALVSATGFGLMPVLAKAAYDDGAEPVAVLAVRFVLAAAALLLLARLLGQPLLFFTARQRIPAGLTTLLLYVVPALVVVLSGVLLRQWPRPLPAGCVVVALVGTALTIGPVQGGQGSGVALLGTVVAVTAFFAALALVGTSDVPVLSTFEPVVSVGAAGLLLGERLSATQVLGGAVVLVAVAVLARAGTPATEPEAVPA